jgi:hypothetical protein
MKMSYKKLRCKELSHTHMIRSSLEVNHSVYILLFFESTSICSVYHGDEAISLTSTVHAG